MNLIRLSSVTYAIRAQKQLERYGIRSYMKKQTGNLQQGGCGYALEVHGDINTAIQAIRSAGIRVLSVE